MKNKIVIACTMILIFLTCTILPKQMTFTNNTDYNMMLTEFRPKWPCKTQYNIALPAKKTTTVTWGGCPFKSATLEATIRTYSSVWGNPEICVRIPLNDSDIKGDITEVTINSEIKRSTSQLSPYGMKNVITQIQFTLDIKPPKRGSTKITTDWHEIESYAYL